MYILSNKKIFSNARLIVTPSIDSTNNFLIQQLKKFINNKKTNVLISGGTTLNSFLKKLSVNDKLLIKTDIFLTDERIVHKKSHFSNEKSINFYLNKSLDITKNFFSILDLVNLRNNTISLKKINFLYPDYTKFSLTIMGVGSDGHIASIFYKNSCIKKKYKNFFITKNKNEKFDRISLNLDYLSKLPLIILVIQDLKKNIILKSIVEYKRKPIKYPVLELIKKSKGKIYIVTSKYFIDRI